MQNPNFKAGYVSILGKPNAGKSTLLNAILKEKLAIVSPKVQTTRHRILGIYSEKDFQIIFSDTPGIIDPQYLMQKRMMAQVGGSLKDADVLIYLLDAKDNWKDAVDIINTLSIKVPLILVINKMDTLKVPIDEEALAKTFSNIKIETPIHYIVAKMEEGIMPLLDAIVKLLPNNPPYYDVDDISDRPMRFFAAELIREQLFYLLDNELPYHSAVIVNNYEEKNTLTKIIADIIVTRESQKAIMLGKGGAMIKTIGQQAREAIEKFIDRKVFLELHIKVRPDWRTKENFLNEYGY
jgi:GTPase